MKYYGKFKTDLDLINERRGNELYIRKDALEDNVDLYDYDLGRIFVTNYKVLAIKEEENNQN